MTLICLDGVDGAGKTTQVKLLKAYFLSRGYSVVILKPYHLIRPAIGKDNKGFRKLTGILKQERIVNSGHKTYKIGDHIIELILIIITIVYYKLEIMLSKIIYGSNSVIIYDRFYFDKLIPKNVIQFKLYYLILKNNIDLQCIILDVPTSVAYKRMTDTYDKLMPEKYYYIIRKWYRIYARLLNFPIINTLQYSPLVTHAMITSLLKTKIPKQRVNNL
ncbi:MAG: hypothetical protein QXE05_07745 [Nitrososphaeria archaeon]